jgi:hypothetical protein
LIEKAFCLFRLLSIFVYFPWAARRSRFTPVAPVAMGPSMAFGTGNPAIQNDIPFHDRQVRPLAHSSFINGVLF